VKKYFCPLSSAEKCQYGRLKRYNYGFVCGTQKWCYYPGVNRAIYPMTIYPMIGETLVCPLKNTIKTKEIKER
jgi:hypothetical protein